MTKKASESQWKLAELFRNLTAHIEREGGLFQGDELTKAEIRSAMSHLKATAVHYEALARDNESIGN